MMSIEILYKSIIQVHIKICDWYNITEADMRKPEKSDSFIKMWGTIIDYAVEALPVEEKALKRSGT